jgi:ADP-ribose pyrophosphatase
MKKSDLFEKQVRKRDVFSGKAVNFRADIIRLPDGKTATREFMDHPGAVAVLPMLENGDLIMVRQYRYPVGEATLEIPAGKLHSKQDPVAARARAELREETGYTTACLEKLLAFWPTPAFSNELLHVYLATGLKAGKASPDEDEFINVETIPFNKAVRLVRAGKIKDAKTIIALQAFSLRNNESLKIGGLED